VEEDQISHGQAIDATGGSRDCRLSAKLSKVKPQRLSKSDEARLWAAFEAQNVKAIKGFIERGWSPSARLKGDNPLTHCDSFAFAKVLIDAGADIHEGAHNWTPLLMHCDFGHEEIVSLLIRLGADPNVAYSKKRCPQIPFGTTPLMKAANHGHLRIVKLLLKAGADINAADEHRHNALYHALRGDEVETAKELLRQGAELTHDVLAPPILNANVEMLRALIAKGANVNLSFRIEGGKKASSKQTPLGYAISSVGTLDYPVEIIELLIEAGADVNAPSNWWVRRTRNGKPLLDVQPVPPLRIAAGRGREDIMELLWKAGAKGTLKEALEGCSLESASFRGNLPVVKLLIKAGVDVNAPGHEGKRPIEYARLGGHREIVDLLKEAGAKE